MHEQRLHALRRSMSHASLDGLLVTHLPHVRYLTGFSGSNGLCIITRRSQCFITDTRYRDQAKSEVKHFRIVTSRNSLFEAAAQEPAMARRMRLGFDSKHLSVAGWQSLKKHLRRIALVPTESFVDGLASIKDDSEIASIRRAVRISDEVFSLIIHLLKPGLSELDVAAEIGYLHRKLGAEADAFEPIVASGPRAAWPHARASAKRIRSGEVVILDFGCRVNGYNSDCTRTVAVGRPSVRMRKVHQIVLDAQLRAVDAARGRIAARTLDAVARSYIKKMGYGKFFPHSLGHGLGLEVHEAPRISSLSKDFIQPGNVVTIEPGVYMPGLGGVRIEDAIIIREDDCSVLNRSPKELLML
ncbi:MAG: aminopeptidase P family protein [Ignavibacteria bacterium]|nr:aminopeptidase P family protein [Ignavibacteria bacterium]